MNAVESLFSRLKLSGDVLQRAKEQDIVKILTLRQMSEPALRALVGNDADSFNTLNSAINTNRGNAAQDRPPPAPLSRLPEDENGRDLGLGGVGGPRGRGRGRGATGGFRGRGGPGPLGGFPGGEGGDFRGGRGTGYRSRGGRGGYRGGMEGMDGDVPPHIGAPHRPRTELSKNFQEDITVPYDSVKWLLADHAKHIITIHHKWSTSNSNIEKPSSIVPEVTFTIFGPTQESIANAKSDILMVVGVVSQQKEAARADYVVNELHYNQQSVVAACVANTRHSAAAAASPSTTGDTMILSDAVMKRLVSSFVFDQPPRISHLCTVAAGTDKEKVDMLEKCAKSLKGAQVIIFAEPDRVEELEKHNRLLRAFGKATPIVFVHRKVAKEDRMKRLETFKNGAVNEKGVHTRVLVATTDYAKLARKVAIPFANLIVHFTMPRNKEAYLLQAGCTGRNSHPGISLLFYQGFDVEAQLALTKDFSFEDFADEKFVEIAEGLDYDTEATRLTPADAEPPSNWKELLEKEVAAKAAAKVA